jgi:hypothetical protein
MLKHSRGSRRHACETITVEFQGCRKKLAADCSSSEGRIVLDWHRLTQIHHGSKSPSDLRTAMGLVGRLANNGSRLRTSWKGKKIGTFAWVPESRGEPQPRQMWTGSTFQISRAYSIMVRSLENLPIRAVFRMAIFDQRDFSRKAASTFFWHSL